MEGGLEAGGFAVVIGLGIAGGMLMGAEEAFDGESALCGGLLELMPVFLPEITASAHAVGAFALCVGDAVPGEVAKAFWL